MHVNFLEAHGHERLCSNTLPTHRYASQILFLCIATQDPFSYSPPLYIQYAKVPHPFTPRIKTLTRTLINLFYAWHTHSARHHSQLFWLHAVRSVYVLEPTARPLANTVNIRTMRLLCYKCTCPSDTRELVWNLVRNKRGFIGDRYSHMLFWIPESCVAFALLIDPTLEANPKEDYIL